MSTAPESSDFDSNFHPPSGPPVDSAHECGLGRRAAEKNPIDHQLRPALETSAVGTAPLVRA
jgi:hypothetical protein